MPKRTESELYAELKDQIEFIERSCDSYDHGNKSEAKRLSAHIDIIVHDRGKTTSLLTQLGLLNKLKFFTLNHDYGVGNILSEVRLCMMRIGNGKAEYIPHLDDSDRVWKELAFSKWWEETIIILRGKHNTEFSRRKLICMMRDQDGGAHVDEKLPAYYSSLATGQAVGWQFVSDNKPASFLSEPHFASVRHIAHELLKTIRPIL